MKCLKELALDKTIHKITDKTYKKMFNTYNFTLIFNRLKKYTNVHFFDFLNNLNQNG